MTEDTDRLKRDAARAALEEVRDGMVLGLGTGSTVAHFLEFLGEALADGRLTGVKGVPSSVRTGGECRAAGIPLVTLDDVQRLDLTVDGADEVSPELDLIKGMGGALLREKMVAQASRRFVVIADEGKAVERLGVRSPLPVEVVDWGWQVHARWLEARGADVRLRERHELPFKSDNGNYILDCVFPDGLPDPTGLGEDLRRRAGVVVTGLFLGMADRALLAGPDGVRSLERDQ